MDSVNKKTFWFNKWDWKCFQSHLLQIRGTIRHCKPTTNFLFLNYRV